ncbi:MAG: TIGR04053 family radical SAM/SPASM domain-containing protein [Planctomycetes bacterium]|nr:TIGR04053 family radical SAM/SPASM domain-containing protein [Planctomycetota bacterium]
MAEPRGGPDFDLAPFIAIWETTQACALACRHCRAEAMDRRDPGELSTAEGRDLISQVAAMGTRVLVLSGGDPLQREDLEDLVRHARASGLKVGTIPAATERLTGRRVRALGAAGLHQMALSLDDAGAAAHDAFRGVPGSFERTLTGAAFAREAGVPLQVNTVVSGENWRRLDAIADLVVGLEVVFWEVFFLVPTGRGAGLQGLAPEEFEAVFERLYLLQRRVPFIIKVTEAPHYRMYVAERERRDATGPGPIARRIRARLARETGPGGSVGQAPRGVNSGKGFVFVSHRGEVYPSGFLPLRAGQVRETPLARVYRDAEVLRRLRDPALLGGRCGRCPYRDLCGGSRARAYALTGDYLAEDPACRFEPGRTDRIAAQNG